MKKSVDKNPVVAKAPIVTRVLVPKVPKPILTHPMKSKTSSITIDLVDKRHIIARGAVFKNRAENWHFNRDEDAEKCLKELLNKYEEMGYKVTAVAEGAYELYK